jgi:endonuclease-8
VPDLSRVLAATVASVEARGKHLLIGFDNGLTLRSHLRMTGSWHRYRPGERWRLPTHRASAILETAESVAVAFDTPVVELLTDAELRRSTPLTTLGPDLLSRDFDADEALHRPRERGSDELGSALLDQRAVAGIGNVYKSETCFLAGIDPWRAVGSLAAEEAAALGATAARLLADGVADGGPIRTYRRPGPPGRPPPRAGGGRTTWVYRRRGLPCRRCGTPIRSRGQGDDNRTTYWCPTCQG